MTGQYNVLQYRLQEKFFPLVASGNKMLIVARNFFDNGIPNRQYFTAEFLPIERGKHISINKTQWTQCSGIMKFWWVIFCSKDQIKYIIIIIKF